MKRICGILFGLCLLPGGIWANSQCTPEKIQEALDSGWDQRVIQSICPPPKPEPPPEALIPEDRPCTDYDRARMLQADLGADAISRACKEHFTFRKNCTGPDRAKMVLAGVDPQTITELCGEAPQPAPAPMRPAAPPPAPQSGASDATRLEADQASAAREDVDFDDVDLMLPEPEPAPEPIATTIETPSFDEAPKPRPEPMPIEDDDSSLWSSLFGSDEAAEEGLSEAEARSDEPAPETDAMSPPPDAVMEAIPMDGDSLWRWGLAYGSQEGAADGTGGSLTLSTSEATDFYGLWQDSSGLVLGGKLETFKLADSAGTTTFDYTGGAASVGWLSGWEGFSFGGLGSFKYGSANLASPLFDSKSSTLVLFDAEGLALYDLSWFHLGLSFGQTFGDMSVNINDGTTASSVKFTVGTHTALLLGVNF